MSDDLDTVAGAQADASFPLKTVANLVKESLPTGTKCSADVAPLMQSCLGEFLKMLTSQANEKAGADGKTQISEAHMDSALKELGFGHYVPSAPAPSTAGGAAPAGGKLAGKKRKKIGKPSELSHEELLKAQEALFAEAKQQSSEAAPAADAPPALGSISTAAP